MLSPPLPIYIINILLMVACRSSALLQMRELSKNWLLQGLSYFAKLTPSTAYKPRPSHTQIRGATNAVKRLCEARQEAREKPVVLTHSSGNHAQALALAARLCGVTAHIVMPKNCSAVKVQAVKDYGGLVTPCDSTEQVRPVVST